MAQKKHPVKNDFYSSVCEVFTDFGIDITMEQMKDMKQTQFKALVKEMCTKSAFLYLQEKQQKGSKGKTIIYTCLKMDKYTHTHSAYLIKGELLFSPVELVSLPNLKVWTLTWSLKAKCTIFGLNRGSRVYFDLYAADLPKNTFKYIPQKSTVLSTNVKKYFTELSQKSATYKSKYTLKPL